MGDDKDKSLRYTYGLSIVIEFLCLKRTPASFLGTSS